MFLNRYGEHVAGLHSMGGFQDFCVVEANVAIFNQACGVGPVLDHAGEP